MTHHHETYRQIESMSDDKIRDLIRKLPKEFHSSFFFRSGKMRPKAEQKFRQHFTDHERCVGDLTQNLTFTRVHSEKILNWSFTDCLVILTGRLLRGRFSDRTERRYMSLHLEEK